MGDESAAGYSARLSPYSNKGLLNLRSRPDPAVATLGKLTLLASRLRTSSHTVIHTGAGLSTAAGIADFRGPNGVWTLSRPSSARTEPSAPSTTFGAAAPTLAHMAILALHRAGLVHYVVSQNVDGLHGRSGLPRSALAELHGNLFVEWCQACRREFTREYEAASVGFRPVGRACACGGALTDKALDWEDELPREDIDGAVHNSRSAEVAVVVGSSCQMEPARGLPFRSTVKGARAVLINLSRTKMDDRFAMTLRSTCDEAFAVLAHETGVDIPVYERIIRLRLRAVRADGGAAVTLASTANVDENSAVPLIRRVTLSCGNEDAVIAVAPYAFRFRSGSRARASVEFSGEGAEVCEWECLVGGEGVEKEGVAAKVDFRPKAETLVADLRMRAAKEVPKPGLLKDNVAVWFCKLSKKRGYVQCGACAADVVATKKKEHLSACESLCKNKKAKIEEKALSD